ncbi:methyltransferase domain-containing protein [Thalassobaculum sp.]|uniref:class I SAM-dependent DNA methyltransferase n=1 Tax=Thalassobaculum sp. TaxID=2022740 RepID=UPI0032EBFA33
MTSAEPFYAPDLATIHAKHYETLAQSAAGELLPLLPTAARVLDLGCGAGPLSVLLAAQDHQISGIDLSASLLSIARQRVPSGRFEQGDIRTANFGRVDAIAAIGEVVNYATAVSEPGALESLALRVRESLPAHGLFLFDCAGPERHAEGEFVWSENPDSFVAMQAMRQGDTITRKITTFIKRDGVWQKSNEIHRLRTHQPSDVARVLETAGFEIQPLPGFGAYRLPNGLHPFLATAV